MPAGMPLRCVVLSTIAYGAGAVSHAQTVTPITKVVELLKSMAAKGEAMKKEEEVKFSAFARWCTDQTATKKSEIKEGSARMEQLDASIMKASSTITSLSSRVAELNEDVGRWKADSKSISALRQKEAVDFHATAADYGESIDALTQAIAVLKKQAYSRPQAEFLESLVQVRDMRMLPSSAKKALTAFLQNAQPDDRLFNEAPQAHGYEFQSGGVVDMLEKLKDEFRTKKSELEIEEKNAQHAFELMSQQLTDNIEDAEHEVSQKSALRGETQKVKAEAEGDLAVTTKDRDEDQKYLDDMTGLCSMKSRDFESRQKLREQELEALSKAIEIISSKSVAGAGEAHLPALLQIQAKRAQSAVLAQLRGDLQGPLQDRVAAFLAERAHRSGSNLLSELSRHVASDPFTKVKKMIKDLIVKLMEEATAEMEHKGWCDAELASNKVTRDSKSADVLALKSTIEDLTATIASLGQDIADLADAVKDIDAAMAKAIEDRASSKAANEQTIKEAKDAQVAIEQAIAVLKDYYAESSQATAFVQQMPDLDAPETFDKPYQGMMPEGGNVADFLEVILTDFARLEAETASTEQEELTAHEKFLFEAKKDKALKENESKHKAASKVDKESELRSTEEELKMTQEQLDKAVAYFDKLKPSCVESGVTYEERVRRREEEIQSLQEALKILAGTDIATDIA